MLPTHRLSDFKILGKYGVPHPVTASHPSVAGNPLTLQPAELPLVISVKPFHPSLYSHGFMKPSGGRPAARSASFTKPRTAAQMGVEPDVPTKETVEPFQMVGKR